MRCTCNSWIFAEILIENNLMSSQKTKTPFRKTMSTNIWVVDCPDWKCSRHLRFLLNQHFRVFAWRFEMKLARLLLRVRSSDKSYVGFEWKGNTFFRAGTNLPHRQVHHFEASKLMCRKSLNLLENLRKPMSWNEVQTCYTLCFHLS